MAQNLRLLQRRIRTAKNIAQIAKAFEMLSASKIKRAQTAVSNNKPYAQRINTLTLDILRHANLDKFTHPYLAHKETGKTLLIVISPDKGLCGSLNTYLFKKILEYDNKNVKYYTLGRKAEKFCSRLSGELIGGNKLGTSIPSYLLVYKLVEAINTEFVNGDVSKVEILYTQFNSIFSQEPVLKQVLPLNIQHEEGDLLPYLFEPKAEELLTDLLPYFLEVTLYNSLLEAFTAEQAARMVAMQNAKNNALDIADYRNLSYYCSAVLFFCFSFCHS